MHRKITGFYQDEKMDWVAVLDCGHGQHTRHEPPIYLRPWVQTEEGRATRIGESLNCVRCDRLEFPDDYIAFKKTSEFNEDTLPDGLKAKHKTSTGIWAKIHVLEGCIAYFIGEPINKTFNLDANHTGTILPEIPHHLDVKGAVRFYVEFYRGK